MRLLSATATRVSVQSCCSRRGVLRSVGASCCFVGTVRLLVLSLATAMSAQQPGTIAIQIQRWVDIPARHLEVRGILNGDTPFLIWLPPRSAWKGRIVQFLQGGFGGSLTPGNANGGYALANGAAYVESTQGHTGLSIYKENDTPTEIAYEASYAVMQYAKARCV